jgi:hypothetical protein
MSPRTWFRASVPPVKKKRIRDGVWDRIEYLSEEVEAADYAFGSNPPTSLHKARLVLDAPRWST